MTAADETALRQRVEQLERRLTRERAARREAEHLLETKSRELWAANNSLNSAVAQLTTLSAHDELTGLPNRRALQDWMTARRTLKPRTGEHVGIISLDLDRFKDVNDTLGHAAGDLLLQALSTRLGGVVRGEDLVVRMGGDEILVLLTGIHDCDDVEVVATKALEAIRLPVDFGADTVYPAASIGVTVQQLGEDPEHALRRADAAMYEAKAAGGDRVVCTRMTGNLA
jgi:diguanylate cyclase (GGDEF)-like protein